MRAVRRGTVKGVWDSGAVRCGGSGGGNSGGARGAPLRNLPVVVKSLGTMTFLSQILADSFRGIGPEKNRGRS